MRGLTLILFIIFSIKVSAAIEALEGTEPGEDHLEELVYCSGSSGSKAVVDSIQHVLGFDEVRDFISLQSSRGLRACLKGMALDKNIYQYYKNLIFIQFLDEKDQLVAMTTLLFQVSSIQGHHSTEGRPWVVLDSKRMMDVFKNIDDRFDIASEGQLEPLKLEKMNLEKVNLENKIEPSSLFLLSKDGFDYYLLSWLKSVTSSNAGLFTSQVSPRFALFKKSQESGEVSFEFESSAFNSILIPAEKLLAESTEEALPLDSESKALYIESLSNIR